MTRDPLVDAFFRGETLTGKMKNAVRKHIVELEKQVETLTASESTSTKNERSEKC